MEAISDERIIDLVVPTTAWDDGKTTNEFTALLELEHCYVVSTFSQTGQRRTLGSFSSFVDAARYWHKITGRELEELKEIERQVERESGLDGWQYLGSSLVVIGVLTFWMALAVGTWFGPMWGALGLFAWAGAWIFAAFCWEQGGQG